MLTQCYQRSGDEASWVSIQYENLWDYCYYCAQLGHMDNECSHLQVDFKRGKVRKEPIQGIRDLRAPKSKLRRTSVQAPANSNWGEASRKGSGSRKKSSQKSQFEDVVVLRKDQESLLSCQKGPVANPFHPPGHVQDEETCRQGISMSQPISFAQPTSSEATTNAPPYIFYAGQSSSTQPNPSQTQSKINTSKKRKALSGPNANKKSKKNTTSKVPTHTDKPSLDSSPYAFFKTISPPYKPLPISKPHMKPL
ncbi:hypothetical protein Tsubulata_045266 [Turnera subulata]|uniref:CCHC-type domain-containing protein n=1 Tax=Turnera subulata TaxID=218843 RepID=A0A9Q0GAF5_9ROSI|nr:hypothetical protein Tsubulata_045266 [Turnera subulata]